MFVSKLHDMYLYDLGLVLVWKRKTWKYVNFEYLQKFWFFNGKVIEFLEGKNQILIYDWPFCLFLLFLLPEILRN